MACNLERRMRKTFNKEELIPSEVKLVFCQEQLANDRDQITVFPVSTEHLCHQHRTDLMSCIVHQLLDWSRYIQRLRRYILE